MLRLAVVLCLLTITSAQWVNGTRLKYEDWDCPAAAKYGPGPPEKCDPPTDPLGKDRSPIETWFTREIFNDLFPKANLGWGANSSCSPYSYESFIIAARYFPEFGTEHVTQTPRGNNFVFNYTAEQTYMRDLAAFFSHSVQETGENDGNLYHIYADDQERAKNCFYRGGLYNWFEGGPGEGCFAKKCGTPEGGAKCGQNGRYWSTNANDDWFNPVNDQVDGTGYYSGCYFGRGTIQISYNFNYGPFGRYLQDLGITHNGRPIEILEEPNLVMTKRDPPLAFMASLWFYMTPQPPKPAMHDIIIGNWEAPAQDIDAGLYGPILGPTSLVINHECGGESTNEPGGGGENRRIKAFRFFCEYFQVPVGPTETLTCNGFSGFKKGTQSYDADWKTTWKPGHCNCTAQSYPGPIPYFSEDFPQRWREKNAQDKIICETALDDGWQENQLGNQCVGQRRKLEN